MIPVLFKGNETNFNHNGIGLLKDTLSCEVSEIRNGSFDLELVYPITGPYFKDLKNGKIIQAKPNDTDQPHNFRITEIDKTLYDKEVVVYGVSTTNDLGGNMVKSLYLTDVTPQVILNEMKNVLHYPTPFNFVSNITTVGSVDWSLNNPLNLIVGEEGSLVDIFGGEVKRTNDTLFLYGRRGKDNVTTIRAGKNLNGFKMTESFQGKYTQILPYFKYEAEIPSDIPGDTEGATTRQEFTVFGSIVSSPYHGRYPVNAIKPIDFSHNEYVRELKTLEALNEVASGYFSDLYSEIDKPSVSINVDMIQLVDSEQYELYEKLEKIELTDTVSVYIPEYDVDVLVKITELKYDSLRERTISIVAGSSGRTSLMDEISGSYKQFTKTLVDDKIQSATSGIINQILTQKNGSNMYAGRATPPENSKPGDIWFKDTGGGDVELYEFDGVNWVRKMYKGFGDDVRQLVDDKIAESNALFTGALEEQEAAVEQANALAQLAKTTATNASLSASAANQDAQKALADAANAKTEALAQFSMVSQALDTAKTNLQNQVSTADSKAVKAQADANALRTDLNKQAQTISAQAQAQTALTNRVTTVETLADGTKTTVVELSKTVDKATGDITSVTNRTKVVEDGLAGVKTNYTQLSQTVNTQTGQIQTINSKTAVLQSGIDGVNQRFENLRIGATNYIIDFGFANINQFKSLISLWTFERISDSTARSGYHIKATCTKAGTHGFSRLLRDLRGTEWQGRKMTYSIDIKASKSVRIKLGVEAFFKSIKAFDVTTDWQRFISTDDVNFKNFYTFPFYSTGTWDVGDVIYLRDPQLEDGTVATTPRAAEEDLKTDITSIKTTITQTSQGVEQLTTSLATTDGKVTTAETKINQLIGDVSSKVSQTDYNTLTGRVTNAESNISQQATQIASKVSQTDFNSEKTKISNLQTSVTQQADQIALKANQTELNNLTGRMSTAEGKITTQAGLIELKAAKTDLTPITNSLNTKVDINQVNSAITAGTQGISQEVTAVKGVLNGGISARNYAVGTGIPSTHSVDSRIETYSMGYVVKQVYSTYKNATLRNLGFKVGDKYTVIFDIYAENNTAFRDYRVEGYNSGYSHIVGSVTNTIGTPSSPTQFVGTTTITEDAHLTAYRWMIRFDLSYFNVTVKNFRIFKGEIKQDWYPAWEDQEAALEATKSRVDITEQSITSLVSGSKTLPDGRTSVFATKIESLEGAITQRVTTQELNNRGYQTSTDVTNTINNRTDLARKTDIPTTSGGRNLAQKTSSEWSTPYTSFYGTTNNCPNLYKIIIDDLAVGDKLKSRIVLKYTNITSAIGQTATIWLQGSGNVTGWSSGAYNGSPARAIVGSGEMIFEHEFTITADHLKNAFFSWAFRTDYIASGSLQWKLAKVEKGPLWTAWTPAHEDAEASITDKLTGYVTNQTYTTYTTDRQQTDGQITEQINQTVSKVPTGPVNLIVNGFDPKTISPWTFDGAGHNLFLATHDFFYNSQKKLYMLYTSNTNEGYLWTNVFNLKRNTKYTIRLGLFAGSATKSCDIYFMGKPSGGSFSYQLLRTINDLSPSKVVYYTITFDSGSFDLGQFRIDNNGSWTQGTPAALYICEVSCIEGEYNNSWTPSFDELITEQKFNETKSTVDAFSRAIGTRDETGFVPNIARLVMTQDAVISEVAKYGEHNNNLVQDSVRFSTTIDMNGSSPTIIEDGNITWRKFGSTTYTWAGIGIPVNVKRFIAGEKYTLSFEYYLYQSPDADIYVEIKDHTNNRGYCYGFIANTSTPINTYHYFQQTFTIDAGTASNTIVEYLYFYLIKNGDIGIRNVMLVRGEKIGPYSTSQVDSVTSRVEQTANSYSVKFLNNANDITTQLNLTSSGARIKSSLIHLDGNVTVSGTAWMDGAIIKNLSADKITTGTLNANNVNITNLSVNNVSGITSTYLQSVIGDAFIDWMRGKMITAMNGNMAIDLNNAKITFNADAKIQFNSEDNAVFRTKNGTSAFIHFRDDAYNGVYTAMGVNADNSGTQNDYTSGSFAGVRVIRTNPNRYSGTIVDQVQIVADEVRVRHAYGYEHDYLTIIWDQGSKIDLVKWMRQFNTNFTHLVNLTGRGDVIKYF